MEPVPAATPAGAPLVVRLDLSPEFGPRWSITLISLAVCAALLTGAASVARTYSLRWGDDPIELLAVALLGVLGLAAGASGLWLLIRGLGWIGWLMQWSARRTELLQRGGPWTDEDLSTLYAWQVRRAWALIASGPWPFSGWLCNRLRRGIDQCGVPAPRAIVVGPSSWWRRLPDGPPRDLVEPEVIRTRPTRGFVGRLISKPAIILVVLSFPIWGGLLAALFLATFRRGGASLWIGIGLLAIAACVTCLRALGISLMGGSLVAGPQFIEQHGVTASRRWMPSNTTLLVQRTPHKAGIIVHLMTARGAKAPTMTLRFFGLDDPGFQTLWKMWLHPVDGVALMNAGGRASAADAKGGA